jgi:hypothetical protein
LHKPEVFTGLAGNTDVYLVRTHLVVHLNSYTKLPEPATPIDTRTVLLSLKGDIELGKGSENFSNRAARGASQLVDGEL